jgi:hypothetical protein
MIPQLVTVGWRRADGRPQRLFVPVLPVLLVLSPVLVLAGLAGLVACVVFRVSSVGALWGVARVLWALPGTRIEIEDGRTDLLISVR